MTLGRMGVPGGPGLGLQAFTAKGAGLIPGQELTFHKRCSRKPFLKQVLPTHLQILTSR